MANNSMSTRLMDIYDNMTELEAEVSALHFMFRGMNEIDPDDVDRFGFSLFFRKVEDDCTTLKQQIDALRLSKCVERLDEQRA